MRHRSVFSSICVIRDQIKVNSFVYIDEIKCIDQLLRSCGTSRHGKTKVDTREKSNAETKEHLISHSHMQLVSFVSIILVSFVAQLNTWEWSYEVSNEKRHWCLSDRYVHTFLRLKFDKNFKRASKFLNSYISRSPNFYVLREPPNF